MEVNRLAAICWISSAANSSNPMISWDRCSPSIAGTKPVIANWLLIQIYPVNWLSNITNPVGYLITGYNWIWDNKYSVISSYWYLSTLSTCSGWWYTYPSEKYEFVSWDDDIPNMMGKIIQMLQTTNLNVNGLYCTG